MSQKAVWFVWVAVLFAALCMAGTWYQVYRLSGDVHEQLKDLELRQIAMILKENQSVLQELQTERYSEKDSGVLESYLAKIRRDGVSKHADMKQRLDQLAENNTAIVALIKAYVPRTKTAAFAAEGDKFRNYASAWRDRWNSVMELFMAGGNYAVAGVPFPKDFPQAVDSEIAATK